MAADSSSMPAACRIPGVKLVLNLSPAKTRRWPNISPSQDSVNQFLASAISLVEASVNEYQRRGFKNLMVSFGCTGGQHRSVYLAEQMAKRLRDGKRVEVVVRHLVLENLVRRTCGEPEAMKAMILAAGLGTRLRPLTDRRPKALVEIGGRTMLEIAISRLRAAGVREADHQRASLRRHDCRLPQCQR